MPTDIDGTILIVDDTEANIDILVDLLSEDYELMVALDGQTALDCVAEQHPDLILLDVMMPGIDGHEACRRLKADDTTRHIPIIFVTAMNQDSDEAEGLALGAVDYITKPFNPDLVHARVRNHLTLHHAMQMVESQRNELQENYDKLQKLEQLRDDLVHMVIHDLRGPLTGITGYLDLIPIFGDLNEKQSRYVENSRSSCDQLINMISSLLDVSKMENNELTLNIESTDLVSLINDTISSLQGLASQGNITILPPDTDTTQIVPCDKEFISRLLTNLIVNAIKFTPDGGTITIGLQKDDQACRISVSDTGPGIPADYHSRIFEKFGQIEARQDGQQHSTGLGLTFCKLAAEAHGGAIGVESQENQGSTFWFSLPNEDVTTLTRQPSTT